jgi:hypothetical protein
MVARIAGSMVVSVAVLMVVSLLVGFGVLWWTGSVVISASIGTLGGLAAAFAVDALHAAAERAGERLRYDKERTNSGRIADHGRPSRTQEGADPKGSQR